MTGFCTHFGALPALPRAPLGPSLGQEWSKFAKASTTTTASGEKGHLAKTIIFIGFLCCSGGPWQALASWGVPVEASQEAKDSLVTAQGHKGPMGIYGNGRE